MTEEQKPAAQEPAAGPPASAPVPLTEEEVLRRLQGAKTMKELEEAEKAYHELRGTQPTNTRKPI